MVTGRLRESAGSPPAVVEKKKKTKITHRGTAFSVSFSPSRLASWVGPSGRRARVRLTLEDVNIFRAELMRKEKKCREEKNGAPCLQCTARARHALCFRGRAR